MSNERKKKKNNKTHTHEKTYEPKHLKSNRSLFNKLAFSNIA